MSIFLSKEVSKLPAYRMRQGQVGNMDDTIVMRTYSGLVNLYNGEVWTPAPETPVQVYPQGTEFILVVDL